MKLHEFTDSELFYETLTQRFIALSNQAIAERQEFSVALAGGKTPAALYHKLNQAPLAWNSIWWFLGDERWVPKGHPLSNEKMVWESLGLNRPGFEHSFLSWYTAGNVTLAAKFYQEKMISILGEPPILDLALLGLGEDGHTASLFPGTKALTETQLFATANEVPQSAETPERLTMTYPVFNAAREIWFLIKGQEKAAMVERLIQRDPSIPSTHIENPNQHVFWLK